MIGVPTNFQAVSNVLANYDFVDIASGTGYVLLYAGNTVDEKILSNFTYYSDVIVSTTAGTSSVNVYVKLLDDDYDVLLNRPLDVAGLGVVNIPVWVSDAGVGKQANLRATVTLRKWDGASETDIVSNNSREFYLVHAAGYSMLSVDLNIPLTHFKNGETLRLTVEIWCCVGAGGGSMTGAYAHDPMNRTTDWDTTGAVPSKLLFQCPVRLNL